MTFRQPQWLGIGVTRLGGPLHRGYRRPPVPSAQRVRHAGCDGRRVPLLQTRRRRGLHRSRRHRIVAGVAGGLAETLGVPVWMMRLVWLILLLPGGLPGVVPYVALWILLPAE